MILFILGLSNDDQSILQLSKGRTMTKEERKAKAEASLLSPFMDDFPENTIKIRRNLLAVAILALFYKLGDLKVAKDSTFLGVKLEGLTQCHIDIAFGLFLSYFILHFLWNSLDYIREYRLRATGMKMKMREIGVRMGKTDGGMRINEIALDDIRQSTLFTWFDQHKDTLCGTTTKLKKFVEEFEDKEDQNLKNISERLKRIETELTNLDTMEAGLQQFGKSFFSFVQIQSWRWLLLEWLFPLIVGLVALGALVYRFGG